MFGLQNVSTNEVGELNGAKNFHYPFRINNTTIFNKHHKSVYHREGDIPPEHKRYNQRVHRSVTNDMNNLMNFNPTRGSEKQKFKEHHTNMHLHYPKSKQRYLLVNNRNTEIQDKIEGMRKPGKHFERYPEHSSFLTPSKGR
jgi:hypothetical protein